MIVACPACALELNRTRCRDAPLFQHPGDFAGAVALRAKLKNQLYHRGRFFVHQQMAVLPPYISVGGIGGQPLAGHSLIAENRPYLLRGVLGVPLVYDIAERGEVVAHLIVAVYSVIDGDKTDSHLWKADFRIQPYLQIIAAKPGHILDDHHTDKPRLNVGHHFLKAGTLEAGAGITVVFIHLITGYPVVFGILGEDFDLRSDLSRRNSPTIPTIPTSFGKLGFF